MIRNGRSGGGDLQAAVGSLIGVVMLAALVLAAATHGGQPPAASQAPAWLLGHLLALVGRWLPLVLGLAGLLVLGWGGLEVLRWTVLVPRTLRTRVAYAILPPAEFEPKPEAIEAFGQQLLGARRRVLDWLDRPACALRLRLTTTEDGRLLYVVELPRRFRGSLFNAYATAYPGVQILPLDEVAGGAGEEAR